MAGLLRHLRKIADSSDAAGFHDAELLERFVQRRDEAAFELLVWRHQRMVLGVCRRVLGDAHDAEDAFQAVFLVLARKAAAVGRSQAVAGWLHTVAYRIALCARAARRKKVDLDLAALPTFDDPAGNVLRRDLAAALDEEVHRLPAKYRLAVVLCYLEGKTYPEAGRQLGLAVGTLAGRLTRARALLRTRLLRRSIDLSGAFLAAWLSEQAADAAAPAALVNGTVKAATLLATGRATISTTVAALTEGALRSMFVSKLKMAAAVLAAGLVVTGMGLLLPAALISPAPLSETPPPATPPAEAKAMSVRVDRHGDPLPAGALFRFGSVRLRHDSSICASAFSPDGKILATTS
jgi:RNA polymerase sigma factor (sigma-70 family)